MFWWTFLIFILGLDLDALLFRIKRVLWLVKSLPNALQGCDESPLPRDFFGTGSVYVGFCYSTNF